MHFRHCQIYQLDLYSCLVFGVWFLFGLGEEIHFCFLIYGLGGFTVSGA